MNRIVKNRVILGKVGWPTKGLAVLKAGRWMLFGASLLAMIEKSRRGVFTNDDIVGLMILWLIFYFAEMSLSRRLREQSRVDANA